MSQDRLKEIKRKIILIQLITAPANISIGLGLYGVFAAKGSAFIAILNNIELCYGLVAVGGFVQIIAVLKLLALWKEQAKIKNGQFQTHNQCINDRPQKGLWAGPSSYAARPII